MLAHFRRSLRFTRLFAVLSLLALAACRADPAVQKQRFVEQGDQYFEEKKFGEASIEYLRALQVDPQFATARHKLALTYDAAGNTRLAFPEYLKAADLLPDNEELQVKTGNLLVNGGFFEEAKERARKVLVKNPNNTGALMVLGNALAGLKSLDDAAGVLRQAVKIDPERTGIYANLGVIEMARGDRVAAEETFKKAVSVSPTSVDALTNLGEFYRAARRYPEAEVVFKQALAIDARDPRLNRAVGSLYVNWGKPADAQAYFEAAVASSGAAIDRFSLSDYYLLTNQTAKAIDVLSALAEDDSQYAAARTRIAMIEFAAGRRLEAQKIVDDVLQRDPRNAEAQIAKARLLLTEQRLKEAAEAIKAAVTLLPSSAEARLTEGRIALAQHNDEAARKAFNEALRLVPNSIEAKLELSELHRNAQQIDTAIQFAEQAVRTNPANLAARLTLIRALLVRPDDEPRAQREIQAVIGSFPRSPRVHGLLGGRALAKNDLTTATNAFRQQLALDPGSTEAMAGLIAIAISRNNMREARARVDAALTQAPESASFHLLSAKVYRYAGDADRMRDELNRAIELDPSNPEPYGMLGHYFMSQGKLADAKNQYEETARLRPSLIGPPTMLGLLNYAEGNKDEARRWWEQALSIDPDSPAAANNLAWLMTERGNDLDTAMQLARRALLKMPDQPEFNDTVGWIFHLKKSTRDAIWYLSQAVDNAPANPIFQFHLGMAYAAKGEDASARRHLTKALELDKDFPEAEEARKTIATLIY